MKIECCSADKVRYETEIFYKNLKKGESVDIRITPCPVLNNTWNLEISKKSKSKSKIIKT